MVVDGRGVGGGAPEAGDAELAGRLGLPDGVAPEAQLVVAIGAPLPVRRPDEADVEVAREPGEALPGFLGARAQLVEGGVADEVLFRGDPGQPEPRTALQEQEGQGRGERRAEKPQRSTTIRLTTVWSPPACTMTEALRFSLSAKTAVPSGVRLVSVAQPWAAKESA